MELDQSTLTAMLGIKSIIACVIFYLIYISALPVSGVLLWSIASFSVGAAVLLDDFGVLENPQLASLVYNIPLVSAEVMFLFGTAQFVGRPFKRHMLPLMLSAVALLALTFTVIFPSWALRTLTLSAIYAGANTWMAWILWSFRATHTQYAYALAAAVVLVQAAAALIQALVAVDVIGHDFPAYVVIWINAIATIVLGSWVLFLLIMLSLVEQLKGVAKKKERERIARDLHDTVLQTFQGFVLKANALLPDSESSLKESLRRCLRDAIIAIQEGRDKVTSLRGSSTPSPTLHEYLQATGEAEVGAGQQFTLRCIGAPRPINSIAHRELCAIGKEAIRNAFRHANAANHEVFVDYGPRTLTLTIRDDGKGIGVDNINSHGRWGIRGMEERAMLIDAKATVHTAHGAGTTWRIEVKAAIAYQGFGRS